MEDVEGEIEEADCFPVSFLVLIEKLIENHIAGELDWKCELEDFCLAVRELCGVKKHSLPFKTEWFCESDSMEEWLAILNQKWQPAQIHLVQIDTGTDSYIFLPLRAADYKELHGLADELGMELRQMPFPIIMAAFCSRHLNVSPKRPDGDTDCCQECSMHKEWVNGWTLCVSNEFDCFRITLPAQDLSVKQLFLISKYFRLTPLKAKERFSAGKGIHVKSALYHTLMTIKILDEMELIYEVEPHRPRYSLFHTCPKNVLIKDRNNYDKIYFDFDEERREEWSL